MSRIPKRVRIDPEILAVLQQIADEEAEGNASLVIRRVLRQSPIIKARLEADARRMGLRVAEVARMRLAEAVTAEARADEPDDQAA